MSKTKIDLVNSALVMVGDNPITSLDDQTTQALVANTVLEDLIEAELFETRWRFASNTVETSFVSSVTHPTGLGVFQIPSNTIRVWNVLERGRSVLGEWEMEGDKLLIDADSNSVISVDRVIEPPVGYWPPHFRMSIIYGLASMFALALTENEALDIIERVLNCSRERPPCSISKIINSQPAFFNIIGIPGLKNSKIIAPRI